MEVVALVNRINAALDRAVEHVYDGATVTPAEVRLLVPLRHLDQPVTAAHLAAQLGMSRAGVSKTLAKLDKRGLITRSAKPADRRATLVSITKEAADTIDALFPRELEAHAEVLAELGSERDEVLAAMTRFAGAMESRLNAGHSR
ncbi:MarR family transcriptional regulator [Saccharopolyspora sp. HNM0986]|nr:MarR family transcriptional regulator [Saccharopolyspora sp. HNM0986]